MVPPTHCPDVAQNEVLSGAGSAVQVVVPGGLRGFFRRFEGAPYPQLWVAGSGRAAATNLDKAFAGVRVGFIFIFSLTRNSWNLF